MGHVVRLNSLKCTEGSPVSSIKCNGPLHSGIGRLSVMSIGRQITDGYGLCTKSRPPLRRLHCGGLVWQSGTQLAQCASLM